VYKCSINPTTIPNSVYSHNHVTIHMSWADVIRYKVHLIHRRTLDFLSSYPYMFTCLTKHSELLDFGLCSSSSILKIREHSVSEIDPVSEALCSLVLENRTMGKDKKPSNSECYTPSDRLCGLVVRVLFPVLPDFSEK
jgi:hypothetical protein